MELISTGFLLTGIPQINTKPIQMTMTLLTVVIYLNLLIIRISLVKLSTILILRGTFLMELHLLLKMQGAKVVQRDLM